MIDVRNNFKNKYEDLMCPRCKKKIDDEKHLFTECEKLADIQNKYNINDPNEVFNEGLFNGWTCVRNLTANATRFLKFV